MAFNFKQKLGWMLVGILCLAPLGFWYAMRPLGLRFYDESSILRSLGQIFGLLGMTVFIINIILSARIRFIEAFFGGIDKAYKAHHLLGGISFLLLLFHPLVLAFKLAGVSFKAAALFLLPGSDNAINFGIVALALFIVLLSVTYFIKLRYHWWKLSHKFLGIVFFLAIFHTFFIASDISRYLPLKVYMAGLVLAGAAAYIYRTILSWVLVDKYEYTVEAVYPLGSQIVEIEMLPRGKKLIFKPGQFIFVSFLGKDFSKEIHPFSISSGSGDKKLKIAIKSLGDYTSRLKDLKPGVVVKAEGPFGRFSYLNGFSKKQIWIGGGIGITPFLSMARSLQAGEYQVELYYCAKTQAELVFIEELLAMAGRLPDNLKIFPFCADNQGILNANTVYKTSGGLLGKDIFLCGPPAMMKNLKQQFKEMGVPGRNIHSEEFNF
jgi:predicted ferric reductase